MSRKKNYSPEKLIGILREAEVRLSQGATVSEVCRGFGVSEQSYYRWCRMCGGMEVNQAHRLKRLGARTVGYGRQGQRASARRVPSSEGRSDSLHLSLPGTR